MPPAPSAAWTAKPNRPDPSPNANAFPHLDTEGGANGAHVAEDCRAQQKDEIEAIRSIFMEHYEDTTT
ncbi:MAG: hypothetical protein M1838_005821, partial [Thelocarpon superellum]